MAAIDATTANSAVPPPQPAVSRPAERGGTAQPGERAEAPAHVRQNVEAIVKLEARAERALSRHQRFIEALTSVVGRPHFLYLVLLLSAAWIGLNTFLHDRALDPPPFSFLQLALTVTGLTVAVMVLITQNLQGKVADQRAHLDLQVNLIAEQKITKLIEMLDAVRQDTPRPSIDPAVDVLKASFDPHQVVDALETTVLEADVRKTDSEP